MASDMMLSFSIGAMLSGSFNTAFASANSTIEKLGTQTAKLTARHERLGKAIANGGAGLGLAKLQKNYSKLEKAIERNRKAQERLNNSIKKSEQLKIGRANLRSEAMETIGTAGVFAAPLIAGAKAAMDFESAMAEVNKTVDFTSADGLAKLGSELKTLSTQIPVSANELATIAASGGQLGVVEKDLIGFTETVAKMSVEIDM